MEVVDLVANTSKNRMNLVAIKKVDPYAKNIIDSSAHVAFYTFNSRKNEWEKTDVEGALFIYKRNAEPFHSLFINNRLNTTSFVEPITCRLEIQSQPPFLLYRNERSRIRGFWFYNSQECDRISEFMYSLLKESSVNLMELASNDFQRFNNGNSNILKMMSKAQKDYSTKSSLASCNVLKFFAAAKPTFFGFSNYHRTLPQSSLSVEQLEKEQRVQSPQEGKRLQRFPKIGCKSESDQLVNGESCESPSEKETSSIENLLKSVHFKLSPISHNSSKLDSISKGKQTTIDSQVRELIYKDFEDSNKQISSGTILQPGLMTPSMFENPDCNEKVRLSVHLDPLNFAQFVDAFSYMVKHDVNFMHKLHEAYLKSFSDTFI